MPHDGPFRQRDRGWHPPAFDPAYKTSVLRSPQRALLSIENTISEMTGPVFAQDCLGPQDNDLIGTRPKRAALRDDGLAADLMGLRLA